MAEKLLHIISTMDATAGGVSQAVKTMITGLAQQEIRNVVVALDDVDVKDRALGFDLVALGKGKSAWNYHRGLAAWLNNHLHDYDRVIVHGLWQYQGLALLRAMRKHREAKVYVMPHGMLDPYFQRAPERKWKAMRNSVIWRLVEKHLIEKANGILFTCETEKLLARETFKGYRPKSELVVGLGVEKGLEKTNRLVSGFVEYYPEIKGAGYWLFISRIDPKKGLDLLIKAYLLLARTRNDLPQLVVAGPGLNTDYGQEMLALAADNANIIFTDMLSGDSKWGAFYGCSAFVLPSHQENFGIAVVEALSCAKPVLISDQVNIWREIVEGKGGLVASDSLEGTAHLLQQWLELTATEKEEMEEKALEVYENCFNMAVAAQRLKEALNNGIDIQ